jgi:hypothetical protein
MIKVGRRAEIPKSPFPVFPDRGIFLPKSLRAKQFYIQIKPSGIAEGKFLFNHFAMNYFAKKMSLLFFSKYNIKNAYFKV